MNQEQDQKTTHENNKYKKINKSNRSSLIQEKLKKLLWEREPSYDYNYNHCKHEIPTELEYNSDTSDASAAILKNKQRVNKNISMSKNSIDNSVNAKKNEDKQDENKENIESNSIKNVLKKTENDCEENKKNKKKRIDNNKQQRNELLKLILEKKSDNKALNEEKKSESKDDNQNDSKDLRKKINSRYSRKEKQPKSKKESEKEETKLENKRFDKCTSKKIKKNSEIEQKTSIKKDKKKSKNYEKIENKSKNEENSEEKNRPNSQDKNDAMKIIELIKAKRNEKKELELKEQQSLELINQKFPEKKIRKRNDLELIQKQKTQGQSADSIYSKNQRRNLIKSNDIPEHQKTLNDFNKSNKKIGVYKKNNNISPPFSKLYKNPTRHKIIGSNLETSIDNNINQDINNTNIYSNRDRLNSQVFFSNSNNNINNGIKINSRLYFQNACSKKNSLNNTKNESILLNNTNSNSNSNSNKLDKSSENEKVMWNSPGKTIIGNRDKIYSRKTIFMPKNKTKRKLQFNKTYNNLTQDKENQKPREIVSKYITYNKRNSNNNNFNGLTNNYTNFENNMPFYLKANNNIINANNSFDENNFIWDPYQGHIKNNLLFPNIIKQNNYKNYNGSFCGDKQLNDLNTTYNSRNSFNKLNYSTTNYNCFHQKFNSKNENNTNNTLKKDYCYTAKKPDNIDYFNYQNMNTSPVNNTFNKSKNYFSNMNTTLNNFKSKLKTSFNSDIEDLIVIEDKFCEIISIINGKISKSVSNECYDIWNYFYNSIYYQNIETFLIDSGDYKSIKLAINYILISTMLCYDLFFESEQSFNIHMLISEIFNLNYKNLILIFENILERIDPEKTNNIWVNRLYEIINLSKITNKAYLIKEKEYNNYEKIVMNINTIKLKIKDILCLFETKTNSLLMNLLNKLNTKSVEEINDFYRENILREEYIERSILATTYLNNETNFTTESVPYIKNKSTKKFTLVLDLDETLVYFKINSKKETDGVLRLRPDVFTFLKEVKKYYELILFSEAAQKYVDLLLETFEESEKFFDYKLYRQHTVIAAKDFVKDLTRIGRTLDSVIIIDNNAQNFRLQKKNGIAIKSFWGEDISDNALRDLIPILVNIAKTEEDVRKGLDKYHDFIITNISSNIYKHSKCNY